MLTIYVDDMYNSRITKELIVEVNYSNLSKNRLNITK